MIPPIHGSGPRRAPSEYSVINRIAFALLWLFIFCVPWEEEVSLAGGVAMSHVIGLASGIAGILACLSTGRIRKPNALHWILVALVAWSALSYFWSVAPDASATRISSYVQLLLMVWLIWEFAPESARQALLMMAYVLGAYVSSLSTIYSFVTGTGNNLALSQGRYVAHGFNENELGIILALSLVMSGYLVARDKSRRLLWLVYVPVGVVAICLTGSRGSFISAAVACLIFPLTFGSFSRRDKKRVVVALLLVIACAIALVPSASWNRIGSIQSELSEGTLTKRTYIWAAGMDVFREHPLIGVGAGAFGPSVYTKLDVPYVAHNSYLSVLVELGVIGEILFLILLAALAHAALTLPKLESRTWILLLTTWAVAVFSTTWEHRKPTWFLFGMLIAQAAIAREVQPSQIRRAADARILSYESAV